MTYLIQAPPYVFAYIATVTISWSSGRYLEHCWHIVGCTVATIVGTIMMISTLNVGARYFGMFLLYAGPFFGLKVSGRRIRNEPTRLIRFTSPGKPQMSQDPVSRGLHLLLSRIVSHLSRTGSLHTSSYVYSQYLFQIQGLIISASIPGASLPKWRRSDHRWMRSWYHWLLALSVVHYSLESRAGEGGGEEQSAQRVAISIVWRSTGPSAFRDLAVRDWVAERL